MDTQDDDAIISQENTPPLAALNENKVVGLSPSKETNSVNGAHQQHTVVKDIVPIDEENAFSFRKKKVASKPVRSSPRRSSLLTSPHSAGRSRYSDSSNSILTSPSVRPTRGKSLVQEELSLESARSVTFAAGTVSSGSSPFSTPKKGTSSRSTSSSLSQEDPSPLRRWDTIWKCSWIVPALVPVNNNTIANSTATTATTRKSTTGFPQRKSATLSSQQAIFDGKDGIKIQGTVTELPGIVFALPAAVTTSPPSLDELLLHDQAIRKENVEMHLVARIRICTFPIFLLAPGCAEPCRIFTSPDSQASSQFLAEMLNDEDIAFMREQSSAGVETAMGSIGLLLRVAPKHAQIGKKKSAPTNCLKQEINPFMMPVALGPLGSESKTDLAPTGEKTGSQRKLFQETSMFLVYGALVKEKQPTGRHAEPIVSFFAYPLVDQASLMDHILLNTRSLDRMKQETAKAEVEPERAVEDFVSYDDPVVDSIMNGCDSEHESGYSSDRAARKDMDLDEDDALHQEMELLRAIERNKSWAPYAVTSTTLPPPLQGSNPTTADHVNTSSTTPSKEVRKERSISRAQTMDNVGMSRKDGSSRSISATAFSRHRSMDGHSAGSGKGLASALVDATSSGSGTTRPVRKGISRIKSPSRAPQKPLDVTTEGLRRKLLGPGSIRKSLTSNTNTSASTTTASNNGGETEGGATRRTSFSNMHIGMKSPSRRAAASGSRGSSSPAIADDIPDLMTMMKLKKRQNIERAALAAAAAAGGREDDNNEDPFSAPSPLRSRATKGESGHAGGSRSGFSGSAGQSNPFLVVLKNIQSEEHQEEAPQQEQEQVQQGHQQNKDDEEMFEALPVKATAPAAASIASTLASSCHSRSQPAPLPAVSTLVGDTSTASTSSKSIELRNRATIKGLTASVLSKNNIGPDHEEFEECADHLYRNVTFAMRKDITTKVYHLEELERLMDRHASMM
ncbi:hypothetical protein BGZ97_002491 [Linnemannia gamsii]|uniref:Sld7 C-terminal domain-containing protein n=1 Tax=Linnemannia gamsii TaxID=64522 RepID=A0A9P6RI77_9FUNG|nr:hypothetical protein BGZ97_002491 [Linnemannia gamsii]